MSVFGKLKRAVSWILAFVFLIFSCGGCQNSKKESSQSGSQSSESSSSSIGSSDLNKGVVLKYKNYEVSLDEYMCFLTDHLAMLCETGVEINSEEKIRGLHNTSLKMAKEDLIFREKLQELGKDLSEERKKTIQASVDESFYDRRFNEDRAKSLAITKKGLKEHKECVARFRIMIDEGLKKIGEPCAFDIFDDDTTIDLDVLDSIDVYAQAKVVSDIVKQKKSLGQKCDDLNSLLAP